MPVAARPRLTRSRFFPTTCALGDFARGFLSSCGQREFLHALAHKSVSRTSHHLLASAHVQETKSVARGEKFEANRRGAKVRWGDRNYELTNRKFFLSFLLLNFKCHLNRLYGPTAYGYFTNSKSGMPPKGKKLKFHYSDTITSCKGCLLILHKAISAS